ncbi:hypothetical protein H4R26_004399 [Coemansia thaxteri]|uniref:Uncharacterized protein n=1 Tax=Coemansia thaxteri TaxID=2663907 RepID=A0A9W8BGB6_9FUNG|nr:hypothetical protein H4R26_004399 [Coemansia thaxteri]KAJ2480031.1 hypothetical protein EV174_003848 [Coemansia sp. RSA 2320]
MQSNIAPASIAAAETEAQKRRRQRQERILNRGSDRLGRIKDTFGAVQEESDTSEMDMVGGHELRTAASGLQADAAAHVAGISLDSLSDAGATPKPRRRAGNLGRKARLEAVDASESRGSRFGAAPGHSAEPSGAGGVQAGGSAVSGSDIDDSLLDDTSMDAIADPGAEPAPPAGLFAVRRFSARGLSRALAKLAPVACVFVYGVSREARYERFVGINKDDVHVKWSGLLAARPDSRLEEWASGNFLFWYLLLLEVAIYSAYFVLSSDGQARTMARQTRSMLAQIPGMPEWAIVLLSAGSRIADSLSILLFLTAVSIVLT